MVELSFKSEVEVMNVHDEKIENYAQAMFFDMKSSNEETRRLLQQRLQELMRFEKRKRNFSVWTGMHEKLLAKDRDAWLFYLLWAYTSPSLDFEEVKALSPFCDQPIYVQRVASAAGTVMRIALDPSELPGVSVL